MMTAFCVALMILLTLCAYGAPLRLHPENPHYFLFRDKPEVLITSAEHYGAVLNLDFDYAKYLETLQRDGMNHTRTFVGAYMEPESAFGIARNTLAPAAGRLICPWARSNTPGYAKGGNKFDLTRWDDAYFARLTDFVRQASDRGIVVEINLFCPFYGDGQWNISPMNAANNVNSVGKVSREKAYSLTESDGLQAVQEAMTRKVVTELNEFDNIFFEIMNEPYVKGVPDDWQRRIADVIVETEEGLPNRHLISQNIANGKAQVTAPHPAVSILNFHYAWPPVTVGMNYRLNRVIGDNETGFKGTADEHYRREGWAFILAGGGLYNNLDYSFTVGHEDGTFQYPNSQPGGGGPEVRKQLRALGDFIRGFDFIRMKPLGAEINAGQARGWGLADPGRQYAVYLYDPADESRDVRAELSLDAPPGSYSVRWVSPVSGETVQESKVDHGEGRLELTSPAFRRDIALAIRARP
ncbi:MAG: cellulase family glycosylhydrolase [Acidobacteriota bacterium]|jgi:hypothetical protein|nr:cellulase family glycosylhydrolase [Acidobacteriota bacterium]